MVSEALICRNFDMSVMNLQPSGTFCFQKTEEWPKWKCHFEEYHNMVSGLVEKEDEIQLLTLQDIVNEERKQSRCQMKLNAVLHLMLMYICKFTYVYLKY